jgi:ribosome-binding protein aMBF1 (putative translation factor)
MNKQIITTPGGERLVVLPEAEFDAIVEAAEDAADVAAVQKFRARLASGEEELLPSDVVNRMIAGENPIRVWREQRGLKMNELAEKAGIKAPYLSQIESGKRDGTIDTMRRLADALGVAVDDII